MHSCRHVPYNIAWLHHPIQGLLGTLQQRHTLHSHLPPPFLYSHAVVCMLAGTYIIACCILLERSRDDAMKAFSMVD